MIIVYIDRLLRDFQNYYLSGADNIGYPSRTIEGRMMDDGGFLPRGTKGRPPIGMACNEEMELIARFIKHLDSEQRAVYVMWYVEKNEKKVPKPTRYRQLGKLHQSCMEWLNDHAANAR